MAIQRVRVIVNPAAGSDEPVLHIMNRVFKQHNIQWKLSITQQTGDARKYAHKASQKSLDLVIVYGGDGTVMDAVNGLYNTQTPLAILPGGTGNAVAAELGIPRNTELALQQICQGKGAVKAVDVGWVEKKNTAFLLRADTGLSTAVMLNTPQEAKDRYGVLAYFITLLRSINDPTRYHYRLTIDGVPYQASGAACIVSNMGSIGTLALSLGNTVRINDGKLDVFVVKKDIRTILAAAASAVESGDFQRAFQHWQGQEITIATDTPTRLNCDAEPCTVTPATIRCLAGALLLFVPH